MSFLKLESCRWGLAALVRTTEKTCFPTEQTVHHKDLLLESPLFFFVLEKLHSSYSNLKDQMAISVGTLKN